MPNVEQQLVAAVPGLRQAQAATLSLRLSKGSYTDSELAGEIQFMRLVPAQPNLLFVGFKDIERARSVAAAFLLARELLGAALQHVGQTAAQSGTKAIGSASVASAKPQSATIPVTTPAASSATALMPPYQKMFGTLADSPKTVDANLKDILRGLALPWVLLDNPLDASIGASYQSGAKSDSILIGAAWPIGKPYICASVVIHELGHAMARLVDICKICHKADLAKPPATAAVARPAPCDKDHGAHHYIGQEPPKELARTHPALAAWNSENYRFYCLLFAWSQVMAEQEKFVAAQKGSGHTTSAAGAKAASSASTAAALNANAATKSNQ